MGVSLSDTPSKLHDLVSSDTLSVAEAETDMRGSKYSHSVTTDRSKPFCLQIKMKWC